MSSPKCQWIGPKVDEHGKLKLSGKPQTCDNLAEVSVSMEIHRGPLAREVMETEGPDFLCERHAREIVGGVPERVRAESSSRIILIERVT